MLVGDAVGSSPGHWKECPVECGSPLATGGQTPPHNTHMARLVQDDPAPQIGWQLQDLGPAGMDNDPLSAGSLLLLSSGFGADSPDLAPGEGGNTLQCLGFCLAVGTMLALDLSSSQEGRTSTPGPPVHFLTNVSLPLCFSVFTWKNP